MDTFRDAPALPAQTALTPLPRNHWLLEAHRRGGYEAIAEALGVPAFGGALFSEWLLLDGTEAWVFPMDLAAASTQDILNGLKARGAPAHCTRFCEAAQGHASAWVLARALWPHRFSAGDVADRDYVGLAAVELWRRWLPDRPCVEAVGRHVHANEPAFDRITPATTLLPNWEAAWTTLERLLPPGQVSLAVARPCSGTREPLERWLLDAANFLGGRAPWGGGAEERARAEAMLAGMLRRLELPHADRETLVCARARLLFSLERVAEAEALLTRAIERDPDRPAPYLTLADGYQMQSAGPSRLQRAARCLERALAVRDLEDRQRVELSLRSTRAALEVAARA